MRRLEISESLPSPLQQPIEGGCVVLGLVVCGCVVLALAPARLSPAPAPLRPDSHCLALCCIILHVLALSYVSHMFMHSLELFCSFLCFSHVLESSCIRGSPVVCTGFIEGCWQEQSHHKPLESAQSPQLVLGSAALAEQASGQQLSLMLDSPWREVPCCLTSLGVRQTFCLSRRCADRDSSQQLNAQH